MKKIGLTGVIGAGKSSVIDILKSLGIIVVDCDQINRELLEKNNKGYQALINLYQEQILDESLNIDKTKMADVIFKNDEERQKVENILHPMIKEEIKQRFKQYQNEKIVVVEVPLLFEIHWENEFDEVWVVACCDDIRISRLVKYRGISKEEAKRRLLKQMPQTEKIKKADIVLYNDSTLEALKQQIIKVLESGE